MKIGEAMYKAEAAGSAQQQAPSAGPQQTADENVVDAEFEEVDDKKKKS
jgi:molecular chaperone DnaK